MIEQQGQVVWTNGDLAGVRLGGTSGCVACDAGKGCGAGVFGRLLKRKPATISVENTIAASAGQGVVVGLPESIFLKLVLRLYAFPLLAGLVGAAIGYYLSGRAGASAMASDALTLIGAAVGGVLAMRWSRSYDEEFSRSVAVYLLRKLDTGNAERCRGTDRSDSLEW